jgi:hypothetical protein
MVDNKEKEHKDMAENTSNNSEDYKYSQKMNLLRIKYMEIYQNS